MEARCGGMKVFVTLQVSAMSLRALRHSGDRMLPQDGEAAKGGKRPERCGKLTLALFATDDALNLGVPQAVTV